MKNVLDQYVEDGLLNRSTKGDYDLYCYNKETFFGKKWDDVTKACRGLVTYKGVVVNHPFPKIFNLDEVDDVSFDKVESYLKEYQYELYHKVNGHLTIVDFIPETSEFLVHTKGSLQDNEMNGYDKHLFLKRCHRLVSKMLDLHERSISPVRYTFMFESINPTDPHTLYNEEVERYGDDQLVLLGGYINYDGTWKCMDSYVMNNWARIAQIPVAERYHIFDDEGLTMDMVKDMFNETGTEGYVIWFPEIDLRVKIKTTDYWKMRFRKDLTADMIIAKFVAGGENRLFNQYPEEVADKVVELLRFHFAGFVVDFYKDIPEKYKNMTNKEVGLSDEFTQLQKSLIFMYKNGKMITLDKLMPSVGFRVEFQNYMDQNSEFKTDMVNQLIQFIEERG